MTLSPRCRVSDFSPSPTTPSSALHAFTIGACNGASLSVVKIGLLFASVFVRKPLRFRDLWLRPALAPRDRSLVTVSALIAAGQVAQIPGR